MPIVLEQDFLTDEGVALDFPSVGYRLQRKAETTPFAEIWEPAAAGPEHAEALHRSLPDPVIEAVQTFQGTCLLRKQLADASTPFAEMFAERRGKTDVLMHRLQTNHGRPWLCNPRPLCNHKHGLLDKTLYEILSTGAVRPSNSPWAFPVILAPNKDGSARFCLDCRKQN